ncbi:hypothetical protein BD410DRAFT_784857 [Rickenella mellea]|uniref:Heat shock factor binding protein 1-domain-containing protein n=1 Tax=Rickenella mellea TaxID=50990 RepID=A0A4Y7QG48_9AGAM|nr:hypothetical protein BD410DRAFT_784857 [Rickenella mellea]
MPGPSTPAQPLKVAPSASPSKPNNSSVTPTKTLPAQSLTATTEISSPHELTAFVETLLEQLDTKFDDMSNQILDRMNQMSTRVDALEASIQDIINGDVTGPSLPQSPAPGTPIGTTGIRRSGSS